MGLRFMKYAIASTAFYAALVARGFAQTATIAGMGYLYPAPVPVAPGQVITVFVAGSAAGNITATVKQTAEYAAPVLEVRPAPDCIAAPSQTCDSVTAVTIQIPYEMAPTCFVCAIVYNYSTQLILTLNGTAGPEFQLTPLADHIHLLTSCDTVASGSGLAPYFGLPCSPLVTHADGSLVSVTSPARSGEALVAYAVGLGATTPAVPTGQAATTATPAAETFSLDFNFRANALAAQPQPGSATPLYSGLVPGYTGLYQINFVLPAVPAGAQPCTGAVQSNLTVSVGGLYSFDGAGICAE